MFTKIDYDVGFGQFRIVILFDMVTDVKHGYLIMLENGTFQVFFSNVLDISVPKRGNHAFAAKHV